MYVYQRQHNAMTEEAMNERKREERLIGELKLVKVHQHLN